MHEHICRLLIDNGARLVYTTAEVIGAGLPDLTRDNRSFHYEVSINEKVAFELALTGAVASKKTACIFTARGLYRALDPLMTSAYTGVIGGFLIVCIRTTELKVTPIGPFSKLPVIVAETPAALTRAIAVGYEASERHQIPFIIQTSPDADSGLPAPEADEARSGGYPTESLQPSKFVKDPGRWAALPKSRYRLHGELNKKIEAIREEFEAYEGNESRVRGRRGVIRERSSSEDSSGEDGSVFNVETVFPLPLRSIDGFIDKMDKVLISEGPYPVMEVQIGDRGKVGREQIREEVAEEEPGKQHAFLRVEETIHGFRVVRDILGPASAINMAHGMTILDPDRKVLAITSEDNFFHSGMPAFVNTIYNGSSYVLLITTDKREDEIKGMIEGWGFRNCFLLGQVAELERFKETGALTVLLCKRAI